jgi:hypothetical protein
MPFFKNVFKSKDGPRTASKTAKHANEQAIAPPKPRWEDAWSRKDVAPEEIQELIHVCTQEMKSRGMCPVPTCAWRVIANLCLQRWTCPFCCFLSAPPQTQAPPGTSCATFLNRHTRGHGSSKAKACSRNCASLNHRYAQLPPWSVRQL